MHKSIQNSLYALTFALLLPGTLMASESSDQNKTRKEAIQLTQTIEKSSRKIQTEADHLKMMRRNNHFSHQSHQNSLSQIAIQVNEQLQPALKRLTEIKPELPQWHQEAIGQMHTSAVTLAANTNAAILNRNPSETRQLAVLDSSYGQLLDNISDRADTLVQVADAASDYGDAQLKGHEAGLAITSHH